MTNQEIERRFEKINARKPEPLTPEDERALAEAEAVNDGTTVTLEEFQRSIGDYSGRLNIRIPKSLHQKLSQDAKNDGVSLNQYILYKLAQ